MNRGPTRIHIRGTFYQTMMNLQWLFSFPQEFPHHSLSQRMVAPCASWTAHGKAINQQCPQHRTD